MPQARLRALSAGRGTGPRKASPKSHRKSTYPAIQARAAMHSSGARSAPATPVTDATTAPGQGVFAALIAAFFKLIGRRK